MTGLVGVHTQVVDVRTHLPLGGGGYILGVIGGVIAVVSPVLPVFVVVPLPLLPMHPWGVQTSCCAWH
ncbi:MAG: hypothetical protein M1399_00865 [Actinobacteria bacterium]|nr:hypothetical protein [Actinomycetota bacterium]